MDFHIFPWALLTFIEFAANFVAFKVAIEDRPGILLR